MNSTETKLCTYWSMRSEDVRTLARKTTQLLEGLSSIDERYARWFVPSESLESALQRPVQIQEAALASLLTEERTARSQDGDELGYHIVLWNGGDDTVRESLSVDVTCGVSVIGVSNCANVSIPSDFTFNKVELVVRLVTSLFSPQWGNVMSTSFRRDFRKHNKTAAICGWLTYLQSVDPLLASVSLPNSIKRIALNGDGTILVAGTQEILFSSSVDATTTVLRLQQALHEAGILKAVGAIS